MKKANPKTSNLDFDCSEKEEQTLYEGKADGLHNLSEAEWDHIEKSTDPVLQKVVDIAVSYEWSLNAGPIAELVQKGMQARETA